MATRSKTKKRPKKKENKEISKEIRRLRTDLEYTLRAVDGTSKDLDLLFTNQANRLKSKIEKLEENQ